MTTPVSGAGTTGPAQVSSSTGTAGDKDMFMKLLVAQLKHQNPMNPSDSNDYMNQMAVFTQVEKLGQLVEAQQAQQAFQERLAAESLVGRVVTGPGTDLSVHTGLVTKVTFGDGGPTLTLADGSTLAAGGVTTVELQQ